MAAAVRDEVDADALPHASPVDEQMALFRRAHELPQLRENRLRARAAGEHAARMCLEGRVAHALADGDPEQRVRRAGLQAALVGEAVARAPSADAAFAAMRRSPSHRMTLLDRRFTDMGVGRARDRVERTCLVVLLAAWPRYIGK